MGMRDTIEEMADEDGQYAIAWALLQVADAIHKLGLNDAGTPMGAVEAFIKMWAEKMDELTEAIRLIADKDAENGG
jgi:hypothetical protein